ncbi:MAG: universal stress protein [Chloroflexi bacterium]|nr:universal stress protein [Chloroflexota bacterium]
MKEGSYRRMLVPLDGSEAAEKLYRYAAEVAGRLGMDMDFLYVCQSESRFMCRTYLEQVAGLAQGIARQVQSAGGGAGGRPAATRAVVASGDVAGEILRGAGDSRPDFIMMSAGSRLLGGGLGSVAQKVVHASRAPVWLLRAPPAGGTMLVPLDGSDLAELVLPHAERLARLKGSEMDIVLLRVCEAPDLLADYPEAIMPHGWDEHVREVVAGSEHACGLYLEEVQQHLEGSGFRVRSEVLLGNPAAVIPDYAEKQAASLVVISSHGRSGPSSSGYGHVAGKVLAGVNCPVFLVRPQP